MEKLYDLYERYRDYIMAFILLALIIGSTIFLYYYISTSINNLKEEIKDEKNIKKEPEKKETNTKIYIDVKGEVNSPGVYELNSEKRVIDAIKLAGGLTKNADTSVNNLGKKLTDEMVIIIYSKNEVKNMSKVIENKTKAAEECNNNNPGNNACLEETNISEKSNTKTSNSKTTNNSKEKTTIKGKISINTATKEELMTLTGIGESKAKNIIEYRSKSRFNDISEIKNVKGIGDSIFEKIKDNITT